MRKDAVVTRPTLLSLTAALLALTACEARFGNDARSSAEGNGSAEGKAEEGRLSISTHGFDMKIDIPESLRREARIDDDSRIIYPNSRMNGIHVQGGRDGGSGNDGEVELRFTTADRPDPGRALVSRPRPGRRFHHPERGARGQCLRRRRHPQRR